MTVERTIGFLLDKMDRPGLIRSQRAAISLIRLPYVPLRDMIPTISGVLIFVITACGVLKADAEHEDLWAEALRAYYFKDRPIAESQELIELDAPYRAEDAAVVPVKIIAKIPQTDVLYIKTITVIIDKNPAPLVGRFHFTPDSGWANLALRVRVNDYSPIRAIAETSDGKLVMSKRFVKASGGCSAPVGTDLEQALKRLGRIKLKTRADSTLTQPVSVQLGISHPNITGLQMDQLSRLYVPAHYVEKVHVSFEGQRIFSAETDISISENPNFRFYFIPMKGGKLKAEIIDNKGMRFTKSHSLSYDSHH